jgi:uncharacterized protein YfkK (UPF0435 family)
LIHRLATAKPAPIRTKLAVLNLVQHSQKFDSKKYNDIILIVKLLNYGKSDLEI